MLKAGGSYAEGSYAEVIVGWVERSGTQLLLMGDVGLGLPMPT
ncbi:MAG: hypothetical protein ACHBN1_08035 [Heteroscytonema crispum UTEX LB 1556]